MFTEDFSDYDYDDFKPKKIDIENSSNKNPFLFGSSYEGIDTIYEISIKLKSELRAF